MLWIIISRMIRIVTLILAMSASAVVLAQVPPGDSYDASKHINPIVTFVLAKDFKTSSYDTAGTEAGISLLGLSKDVGTLENVETAAAGIQEVREGRNSMKVTFYPVVRQTFKLADGGALVLCSFKAPQRLAAVEAVQDPLEFPSVVAVIRRTLVSGPCRPRNSSRFAECVDCCSRKTEP